MKVSLRKLISVARSLSCALMLLEYPSRLLCCNLELQTKRKKTIGAKSQFLLRLRSKLNENLFY